MLLSGVIHSTGEQDCLKVFDLKKTTSNVGLYVKYIVSPQKEDCWVLFSVALVTHISCFTECSCQSYSSRYYVFGKV